MLHSDLSGGWGGAGENYTRKLKKKKKTFFSWKRKKNKTSIKKKKRRAKEARSSNFLMIVSKFLFKVRLIQKLINATKKKKTRLFELWPQLIRSSVKIICDAANTRSTGDRSATWMKQIPIDFWKKIVSKINSPIELRFIKFLTIRHLLWMLTLLKVKNYQNKFLEV